MNKDLHLNDPYEIARYIKEAKKTTPIRCYLKGDLKEIDYGNLLVFGNDQFAIVFGEHQEVLEFIRKYKERIAGYLIESDRRNSAIPLLDITKVDARIEPGAIIRDRVVIGKNAVIMMGALINIGAEIGDETMIDMNAVIGSRGIIGKRCHIGAGAVISGVLEPPSKTPVIIEDDVLVGANAVILEGIRIGKGAVVAAGAVVTEDVLEDTVVAGVPAKVIKRKDSKTIEKTKMLDDLRK